MRRPLRTLKPVAAIIAFTIVVVPTVVFMFVPDPVVFTTPYDASLADVAHVGYIHQHRRTSGPFADVICPIQASRTPTETKGATAMTRLTRSILDFTLGVYIGAQPDGAEEDGTEAKDTKDGEPGAS